MWTGSRSTGASATRAYPRARPGPHLRLRPVRAPARDAGIFVVQEHHARRLHWDFRLERDGVLVSWALPKGVPDDPGGKPPRGAHRGPPARVRRRSTGRSRAASTAAGAVTIWDHGTYEVLKWDDREVKVVLHGERVTGGYALFATGGKNWMIHRERLPLARRR